MTRQFDFSDETYDQLLTMKKFCESLDTKMKDTPGVMAIMEMIVDHHTNCLLYTSPSPRD